MDVLPESEKRKKKKKECENSSGVEFRRTVGFKDISLITHTQEDTDLIRAQHLQSAFAL